jgi:hypothetical protein
MCVHTYVHANMVHAHIHIHIYAHVQIQTEAYFTHTCRELAEEELKVATARRDVANQKLEVLRLSDAQESQVANAKR